MRAALILLAVLFWLMPECLPAADASEAVLDQWFTAQQSLKSWSADFIQTRTLPALTQPLVAHGHVDFALPGDFRWLLGQPARSIALGHGSQMYVIYPLLKRAELYPLGPDTPKQWRDMMSLLQAGFPRNRQEFNAQFKVLSLTATHGDWLLALAPASAATRQMVPELRLRFATNDFQLAGTEMIMVDGSRMRTDFTNAVLNSVLDPHVFSWQPPPDFKVTEPLSK